MQLRAFIEKHISFLVGLFDEIFILYGTYTLSVD